MGVIGNYQFTSSHKNLINIPDEKTHLSWIQGEFNLENYFPIGNRFTIGAKINAIISTKKLVDNYTANIVQAPAFTPTPATKNYFNPRFRANSYLAGGLIPLYKITDKFQIRTEFYAFAPFREMKENSELKAEYGSWFNQLSYMGEASLVYNFSFASFSIYGNYLSYPANNWNFGVSFGLLFSAPKFLR